MKRIFRALMAMLALWFVTPTSAAEIVYIAGGNASGMLNGSGFSGPMQVTSFGDLSTRQPCTNNGVVVAGCQFVFNNDLFISSQDFGVLRVLGPSISFFNDGPNVFGFSLLGVSPQLPVYTFAFVNVGNFSPAFASWDGISDIGALTNWGINGPPNVFIATDGGTLTLQTAAPTGASFAALNLAASVPEPASWAMMILGFALVGGAMRRRSQVGKPLLA